MFSDTDLEKDSAMRAGEMGVYRNCCLYALPCLPSAIILVSKIQNIRIVNISYLLQYCKKAKIGFSFCVGKKIIICFHKRYRILYFIYL